MEKSCTKDTVNSGKKKKRGAGALDLLFKDNIGLKVCDLWKFWVEQAGYFIVHGSSECTLKYQTIVLLGRYNLL